MDLPNCLLIVDQVQHVYECTPLIGGGSGRIVRMEIPDPTGNSYAILGTLPYQIDVIRIRGVTLNGVSRVSKGACSYQSDKVMCVFTYEGRDIYFRATFPR